MEVEKILEKLVSFDTVADAQNGEIMSWLEKCLSKSGFVTEKIRNNGKVALWAKLGKNRKTGLTFIGHTDTVPAGSGWTNDPFRLTRKGDRLYGLGTSDMKSGIAAFLKAVEKSGAEALKKNLEAVFTYDEEKLFTGIKDVMKKKELDADAFLIGEPTGGIPVVAHKGLLALRITFFGKAAHGSDPDKGENAIYPALQMVQELKKYAVEIKKQQKVLFDPAWSTFNLGKINGGDAINKVPSECASEFEWRLIDEEQRKKIFLDIGAIIKKNGWKAEVESLLSTPMVQSRKNFISEIEAILGRGSVAENYATEASFLGKNNIIILGPGPENAHVADEFVSLESLSKTAADYARLIDHYCG